MSWIDTLLNFIIPPGVVIFLAYVLLKPFSEPLGKLWDKIGHWRENREESEVELNIDKYINYE